MRGNNLWYLDSGCSKHMTGDRYRFLSLTAYPGGTVTFGDNQTGKIVAIGKVGDSNSQFIENVFLVDGLKHNLLSISQFCDKGNVLKFTKKACIVKDECIGIKVLEGTRRGNTYVVDLNSVPRNSLTCLRAVEEDPLLWHKRCGHASLSLLNKLNGRDLVDGLPSIKFVYHGVCDACARGKQVRSSFKSKKMVSTQSPLELLHMDLFGPVRIQSRSGKRYVFVIVDDFSRYTWVIFLYSKDEVFDDFVNFAKKVQRVSGHKIKHLRSDHGTEFENSSLMIFAAKRDWITLLCS